MSDEIRRLMLGAQQVGKQGSYAGAVVHAWVAGERARNDWARYSRLFGVPLPGRVERARYWTVHNAAWKARRRNRRQRKQGRRRCR